MSNELATTSPSGTLALAGDQVEWTEVQAAALAHIGIDKAPAADQQVFRHVCQLTGLDPFRRQIYMIARKERGEEKWTIQTGIDGFRLVAEDHPQYAGTLDPQWCGPDGVWRDVWTDPKPPVAARVVVLRHDRQHPISLAVRFSEFAATFADGNLQGQWRTKPAHMIGKCAEAASLRKAFPRQLSGVYTEDEMAHVERASRRDRAAAPNASTVTVAELTGAGAAAATSATDDAVVGDEPDWDTLIVEVERTGNVTPAWKLAREHRPDDTALRERIQQAGQKRRAPAAQAADEPVDAEVVDEPEDLQKLHRHMHAIWNKADVSREERLAVTSHLIGRDIESSKELTAAEAALVIGELRKHDGSSKALYGQVSTWLEEYAARASEQAQPAEGETTS
jgi:phage recombination protein Bet